MLLTNHVLSGALIGAMVRRPVPAFALGVGSHFVLDAVPHWGGFSRQRFLQLAVADGLTGAATMSVIAAATPRHRRLAVIAGMLGAALPDADKPASLVIHRSPWPAPVARFHSRIQDEAPDRYPVEVAAAALFAVFLRGATPRTSRRAVILRGATPRTPGALRALAVVRAVIPATHRAEGPVRWAG